ncbi:PAAR domain-containing protein [Pseudomonas sp. LY-1]|uniref:PAAR domain-containing protein n=1 Tax=Pseudomonas veronii TaxID=76761 RepID=A0ABS0VK95_PSEVE|nr:PAAR domain-containing protein [Pseudomonas veronii]MBI6556614.1 PAAR domain-containing protein [Pseudomonas veronii]MBI6651962.1 PAAR domain-containing protein [Pseudomonas veronii]
MPAVVLVGHDHDCPLCGPTTINSGTRNVTVNGRAVARVGDTTDHDDELENGDSSWLID